ncbi:MAG: GNAT family N-acetyltransferase [Bacteroidota bacterium]
MEQIRLATLNDAKHIAELGKTTFREAFGAFFDDPENLRIYLETTFNLNKIEQSIIKENNVYWIALVDEKPVGYAKLKLKSPSPFLETDRVSQLQKIYVLQDFLSMKIGKRLQDALIARAQQTQNEQLWLSVWNGNKRAIRFYEKNDFKIIGNHQFTIGEQTFDFTAMSKSIV